VSSSPRQAETLNRGRPNRVYNYYPPSKPNAGKAKGNAPHSVVPPSHALLIFYLGVRRKPAAGSGADSGHDSDVEVLVHRASLPVPASDSDPAPTTDTVIAESDHSNSLTGMHSGPLLPCFGITPSPLSSDLEDEDWWSHPTAQSEMQLLQQYAAGLVTRQYVTTTLAGGTLSTSSNLESDKGSSTERQLNSVVCEAWMDALDEARRQMQFDSASNGSVLFDAILRPVAATSTSDSDRPQQRMGKWKAAIVLVSLIDSTDSEEEEGRSSSIDDRKYAFVSASTAQAAISAWLGTQVELYRFVGTPAAASMTKKSPLQPASGGNSISNNIMVMPSVRVNDANQVDIEPVASKAESPRWFIDMAIESSELAHRLGAGTYLALVILLLSGNRLQICVPIMRRSMVPVLQLTQDILTIPEVRVRHRAYSDLLASHMGLNGSQVREEFASQLAYIGDGEVGEGDGAPRENDGMTLYLDAEGERKQQQSQGSSRRRRLILAVWQSIGGKIPTLLSDSDSGSAVVSQLAFYELHPFSWLHGAVHRVALSIPNFNQNRSARPTATAPIHASVTRRALAKPPLPVWLATVLRSHLSPIAPPGKKRAQKQQQTVKAAMTSTSKLHSTEHEPEPLPKPNSQLDSISADATAAVQVAPPAATTSSPESSDRVTPDTDADADARSPGSRPFPPRERLIADSVPAELANDLEAVAEFHDRRYREMYNSIMEMVKKTIGPDAEENARKQYQTPANLATVEYAAMEVGEIAPDFTLPIVNAQVLSADSTPFATPTFTLSELVKRGPVVLIFYRGAWCMFCNLFLHRLSVLQREVLGKLKFPSQVVAVSMESWRHQLGTASEFELEFPVLNDPAGDTVAQYGLWMEIAEEFVTFQSSHGVDLRSMYGFEKDEKITLPIPATFVIDQERRIVFRDVDLNIQKRATPAEIVDAVKQCQQMEQAEPVAAT